MGIGCVKKIILWDCCFCNGLFVSVGLTPAPLPWRGEMHGFFKINLWDYFFQI